MINTAALILKYKEPAIKWINEADPYKVECHTILEDTVDEPIIDEDF